MDCQFRRSLEDGCLFVRRNACSERRCEYLDGPRVQRLAREPQARIPEFAPRPRRQAQPAIRSSRRVHPPRKDGKARERLSVNDEAALFSDRELPGFGLHVYPSGAPRSTSSRLVASVSRSASPWDDTGMSHRTKPARKPLAQSPAARTERRPFRSHGRRLRRWPSSPSAISVNMSGCAAGWRPQPTIAPWSPTTSCQRWGELKVAEVCSV